MQAAFLTRQINTPDDMARIAATIAVALKPGDTLLLEGPIGSGKSTFARAAIRTRLARNEDVPSPTFTLVQTYDDEAGDIWHCDLYRLTDPQEVLELGLDAAFAEAICLIEWPDRLGEDRPDDALLLTFAAMDKHHELSFSGNKDWQARLEALDV